jgi:PAS domain S-box-containing protein
VTFEMIAQTPIDPTLALASLALGDSLPGAPWIAAALACIAAVAVLYRLLPNPNQTRELAEQLKQETAAHRETLTRLEQADQEIARRAAEGASQCAISKERFDALMEVSAQMVWTATPTGEIHEDCPGWRAFTGQSLEETRDSGWRSVIHPDDFDQASNLWRQAVETKHPLVTQYRLRHASGQWRWMSVKAIPLLNAGGEVREWVGTSTDVTDQKEAREALERLNAALGEQVAERTAQLERSQQLEALGWLTGGVAHDFNNLLAVILGNMHLLQKRFPGDEKATRLIRNAINGAERGAKLTELMLAFSQRQRENRTNAIRLAELTQELITVLRSSLGAGVRIETDIPDDLWTAQADPNLLEMALVNLAVNARDAMPSGGALAISARNEHVAETFDDLTPGDYIRIAVTDTGVGMDQETLARATEPFFTTKDAGKGAGLGLCMVQDLAAQSGGALRLSSTLGEGATIKLWLPRAGLESAPQESAPSEDSPPPQTAIPAQAYDRCPITVLVVDDDALTCMATADMLTDKGFIVIEANSGYRALEVLKATPEISVVVADHAMPGMTGLRLAREIRAGWPKLPILMASGFAELSEAEDLELPRLNKPYNQKTLISKINELLAPPHAA